MKSNLKKLQEKNWKLCREIVLIRDKFKCQICGSKENLQVDHAISRVHKILFYEISNLTTLCSKCHTTKSFQKGGNLDKRVDQIVIKREGQKKWNEMIDLSRQTFPDWSRVWYQEEKNKEFKIILGREK